MTSQKPSTAPTESLHRLQQLHEAVKSRRIASLFADNSRRFDDFSAQLGDGGLLLDYSKTQIDKEILAALIDHAEQSQFYNARERLFAGERINGSEGRAVLHMALRGETGDSYAIDGHSVMPEVLRERERFLAHSEAIRADDTITDIVHIGIGGSDLGGVMACQALAPYHGAPYHGAPDHGRSDGRRQRLHFVSNIDSAQLSQVLQGLVPQAVHFIIASKTFTTIETMTNAKSARNWMESQLPNKIVGEHFTAVTSAVDKAIEFGIAKERIFSFWDWVGGRYSIWSAIGLPLAIAIGREGFLQFLAGGRDMDENFRNRDSRQNLPMLLGLIGYWHRAICGYGARAIIPYAERLARFPAYLQQLDMESNGKSIGRNGKPIDGASGAILFGEPGTNSQHAFFQWLHQGSDIVPVEFLLGTAIEYERPNHPNYPNHALKPEDRQVHQQLLVANCLAQSNALMEGQAAPANQPHRGYSGNRPSVTIVWRQLTPRTLGRLIALYEHRVFTEGWLFGINSFDQWGVELGKGLAMQLLPMVQGMADFSTAPAGSKGILAALDHLRQSRERA